RASPSSRTSRPATSASSCSAAWSISSIGASARARSVTQRFVGDGGALWISISEAFSPGGARMIVDIHAHDSPRGCTGLLRRIGGKSLPEAARPLTARPGGRPHDPNDIQIRLERMADAGVEMQVLSPAASPPYAEKEADAVAAARLINDAY